MDTRRAFLKKAMMLSGAAACYGGVPESIRKATAIDPAPGSTFADAEHVVILMQENRSFDHCFGTLKGVRGFNDPRAIELPNGHPVWLQSSAEGETFAPFRFDMRDTKITWMGSVPHSRSSQVDANNLGKYDRWIDVKRSGHKAYRGMPLTMGYYTREDLPFNYALADAFTVCDQNFSSAMTSTWPNRLFLWSGAIRGEKSGDAKAYIRNDIPYGEAHWTSFPELLEDKNISWKVYQNEISTGGGFAGDERAWLSNFGCNLLENLSQFQVRYSPRYVKTLRKQVEQLPKEIAEVQTLLAGVPAGSSDVARLKKQIAKKQAVLAKAQEDLAKWSDEAFARLTPREKSLHEKAFGSNAADPDFLQMASLSYDDQGQKRDVRVPKGDILYQFRQDVMSGKLPTVSWMVGPENFSDHPVAPWYGSWYVSEILDILTQNPEVWKKTIFVLTYDENDGYFDHVPPFVAPDPRDPATGKCSAGIDTAVEFIRREQELQNGVPDHEARGGPIGLGYRVPMIIASPWSRGGRVCSQVFDHTSVFRFVQEFVNRKAGKQVLNETNTSEWRKTVSGNLTSAFQPFHGESDHKLTSLQRDPFIEGIYTAKFKDAPTNFKALTPEEIAQISQDPASPLMPHQEPGVKPACALPYELYAHGNLSADRKSFAVTMEARNEVFGKHAAGAPFNIYFGANVAVRQGEGHPPAFQRIGSRSYAVAAGTSVPDSWPIAFFEDGRYHVRLHGPNGFYREFKGDHSDPAMTLRCEYERATGGNSVLTGKLQLAIENKSGNLLQIELRDHSYKSMSQQVKITGSHSMALDLSKSFGWYDFSISIAGHEGFYQRFAGHVETGQESTTDPMMGRVV